MKFAKLYEHEKLGQVLVTTETDHKGCPSLRLRITMDGMEVASNINFNDSDAGWGAFEDAFQSMDEEKSLRMAEKLFNELTKMVKENDDASN